jgi:SAM-dependent methyltransferase
VRVLVTVGMSPWPFDRLIGSLPILAAEHDVFAQTGTATVAPPCRAAPFVAPARLEAEICRADVVVTHAGNTVRLVQRAGKVPVVVAREARRGEMVNDHQVEYLQEEERRGLVAAVWDVSRVAEVVRSHPERERLALERHRLPPPPDAASLADLLDGFWQRLRENPFSQHPLRRYAYAWDRLASRHGRHLDFGFGDGEFLAVLAATTALECHGVEPHRSRYDDFRRRGLRVPIWRFRPGSRLPFPDGYFASISALDVLEHCGDEGPVLEELGRVLVPGGRLIVTVPARHWGSRLDPDNVKLRHKRLHRVAYSARFGREEYRRRFGDRGDGLFGDMTRGAREHRNYRRGDLCHLLVAAGFDIADVDGAGGLWRAIQVPGLLAPSRLRPPFDRLLLLDGRLFRSANVFMEAVRT